MVEAGGEGFVTSMQMQVQRIQNPVLWACYSSYRQIKAMQDGDAKEVWATHGSGIESLGNIAEGGSPPARGVRVSKAFVQSFPVLCTTILTSFCFKVASIARTRAKMPSRTAKGRILQSPATSPTARTRFMRCQTVKDSSI